MKLVVDACALINLSNGGAFAAVLSLSGFEWSVGPIVVNECGGLRALQDAMNSGAIHLLDDTLLGMNAFMLLRRKYRLGPGETECIAFAATLGLGVCTDDGRARAVATTELGADSVTGTIGLLKRCVAVNIMKSHAAVAAYRRMVLAGAFLPTMHEKDFT